MALVHFAQQNVQAAVMEVGLGGRLDATNVCRPAVSVITSISFDHTQQLGNTLALIAGEKAGIIKPGVPVVSGVIEPGAAGRNPPGCREHSAARSSAGPISISASNRRGIWNARQGGGGWSSVGWDKIA